MFGKIPAIALMLAALSTMEGRAESDVSPALIPPVGATCISSAFGPRVLRDHPAAGTYHPGIDLPAPLGAAVVAAAPGTVVRVQRKGPGGLEMLVQHAGFVGVYSHFGLIAPAFAQGKRTVGAGEKLGVVGRTGLTSGAHLFFGMLLAGKPVDPSKYLRLPFCSGVANHVAPVAPDDGGTMIGGRRYWLLSQQH
jgi:murein DD-endopeptidase MepM/ murein hydrolase activator NlpD